MKSYLSILILLLFFWLAASLVAQDEADSVRRTSFIESRQGGHPDGPDMIGRAKVSKDDTLMCMLVEVYDETHQASTACVVKFKNGTRRVLTHGQFMKSVVDSEVSLQCSGYVPRRCMIELNDPVNQPPIKQARTPEPGDPSP